MIYNQIQNIITNRMSTSELEATEKKKQQQLVADEDSSLWACHLYPTSINFLRKL